MRVRAGHLGVAALALATLMASGVVLRPAPAAAQDGRLCDAVASVNDQEGLVYKNCLIDPSGLPTPSKPPPCSLWDLVARSAWDPNLRGESIPPPPSPNEIWVAWICADGTWGSYMFSILIVDPPDPEDIRDDVAARIRPPTPIPATVPDFDTLIVRAQTWLWLDGYAWSPLEDSDSQGGISVTVRATPKYVTWVMGDGGSVVCSGPGTPWTPGAEDAESDCHYTYTDSSSITGSGTFAGSVTVTWEFEWWEDGVYRGVFGTVEPTAPFTTDVDEIQAIETGG